MKIIAAATIAGMVATAAQPTVAQTTDVMAPLSPLGQFGVCGLLGGILWWTLARTIPRMSQDYRDGMTEVAGEIKGMRDDMKTNMQAQIECLRGNRE